MFIQLCNCVSRFFSFPSLWLALISKTNWKVTMKCFAFASNFCVWVLQGRPVQQWGSARRNPGPARLSAHRGSRGHQRRVSYTYITCCTSLSYQAPDWNCVTVLYTLEISPLQCMFQYNTEESWLPFVFHQNVHKQSNIHIFFQLFGIIY